MLKLNGNDVGALFQKGEMMKDVPTHWASYVSVTSADETVAKAKSLGGTIRQEAFDVMDIGRMAVITDPTGGTFCIWEPKEQKATSLGGRQYVPPTDIPKVGRFAVLSDPQGAVFSIIKLTLQHEKE